jgi:hypothetical protein
LIAQSGTVKAIGYQADRTRLIEQERHYLFDSVVPSSITTFSAINMNQKLEKR